MYDTSRAELVILEDTSVLKKDTTAIIVTFL